MVVGLTRVRVRKLANAITSVAVAVERSVSVAVERKVLVRRAVIILVGLRSCSLSFRS